MAESQYIIERRADGAVVVRVISRRAPGQPTLPDAVFSFHIGDPQFEYWSRQLAAQKEGQPADNASTLAKR